MVKKTASKFVFDKLHIISVFLKSRMSKFVDFTEERKTILVNAYECIYLLYLHMCLLVT